MIDKKVLDFAKENNLTKVKVYDLWTNVLKYKDFDTVYGSETKNGTWAFILQKKDTFRLATQEEGMELTEIYV